MRLKPCPFCGSSNVEHVWSLGAYIFCNRCDAQGGVRKTELGAIRAWNKRKKAAKKEGGGNG